MQPTLEPDLLRSFVAIAETGSFTAASRRVHRTQSAVSMQIKRLEETLGRALFERDGRSVALTPHGEVLLDHARKILRVHQEALAAFDANPIQGEVTVGSPDDYASTFLPGILARFGQTHPHVPGRGRGPGFLGAGRAPGQRPRAACDRHRGARRERRRRGASRAPGLGYLGAARRASAGSAAARNLLPDLLLPASRAGGPGACGSASRIAYSSLSIAGIYAAIDSGLAVAAELRATVRPGQRILTEAEGFPPLPDIGITLQRSPHAAGLLIDRLEQHMLETFRASTPFALAA